MILGTFLLISVLISFGLKYRIIKSEIAPHILIAVYTVSLLPSINIPYIIDDFDHLYLLSKSIETSQVSRWLFTPHNEHVIPALKFLYYICYKHFWLYPEAFHFVIIGICIGILYLTYGLLYQLTGLKQVAFIGLAVLAGTNLFDRAAFVITNSHIIFCLFFLLLMFYSQLKYFVTKRGGWIFLAGLSVVLSSMTFSLGLTSIVFFLLFHWLCISGELKKEKDHMLLILFACWALSLVPYLLAINAIIFAKEYQYVAAYSTYQAAHPLAAFNYLIFYFHNDVFPALLPNLYLSLGLFFFVLAMALRYKRIVAWKKVFFFLLFGLIVSYITTTFRVAWGPASLGCERYYVFPAFMVSVVYALLLEGFFKEEKMAQKLKKNQVIMTLCCFLVISFSGAIRYQKAAEVSKQTNAIVQRINLEIKVFFSDYFEEHPGVKKIRVNDPYVILPAAPSLTTSKGFAPDLARYARRVSFYCQYVLPQDLKSKIIWSEKADQDFLTYLSANKDTYFFLSRVFQVQ